MSNALKSGVYKHYKGRSYEVIGKVIHSESLEELVLYKALYGDYGLWVRPVEMFTGYLEVDGETKKRFEYIDN